MGSENESTQCISTDSGGATSVDNENLTTSDDLTIARQASSDGTLTFATGNITDSDTSIPEWANYYMDHLYYVGSIALVGCLIAIEAGTGTNVVEIASKMSYIFELAWNSGDGVGAAAIVYNEMDVGQFFNAVQLFTVAGLVVAKTFTAPFASASFALAMGITAGTEASNYLKKQSEVDDLWTEFKASSILPEAKRENYNNIQTEALKHRDTAVAYSVCTIAMGIVAVGAFAATGPVAPATFLIVSILTVGLSVCGRYIAQNNKASKKYDYDHLALRQLEKIEVILQDLIPTSTCQCMLSYFFNVSDTITDSDKIKKIKKLKEITKELKQMIKGNMIKIDDIADLLEDIQQSADNIKGDNTQEEIKYNPLETESHKKINTIIEQYNTLIKTASPAPSASSA